MTVIEEELLTRLFRTLSSLQAVPVGTMMIVSPGAPVIRVPLTFEVQLGLGVAGMAVVAPAWDAIATGRVRIEAAMMGAKKIFMRLFL